MAFLACVRREGERRRLLRHQRLRNGFFTKVGRMKKILAYLTSAFFVIFGISCATVPPSGSPFSASLHSLGKVEAAKFPEVQLVTTYGDQLKGKIFSLEGDTVTFLLHPYWNVEPLRIGIDKIHSIERTQKKSWTLFGLAAGFGSVTMISGMAAAKTCRYDKDFSAAMGYVPLVGLGGGLIGLAIGGIADLATGSKYDLSGMAKDEKIQTLMAIMGL
jgi:hypothetical protein